MRKGAAAPVREVVDTPAEDMVAAPDEADAADVIIEPDADEEPDAEADALDETPDALTETVKMAEEANVLHCDVEGVKMVPPFERAWTF